MSTAASCLQCGTALPENILQGLCPRCLTREAEGILNARARSTLHPPSLSTLRYFGDYELLDEIARGGMGVVFKARQVSLNRLVAVKMLLSGQFAGADFLERFRKEAEAAANLQHPHIVAIHEIGEHAGQQYFSMDYVEGGDLAQLARNQPLPARRAAALLQTIAGAVQYAHERGVLHRDLKPSNILLDDHGQPRVTDFGLAKRFSNTEPETPNSELTLTGQVLGTPGYMSPEQAGGRRGEVTVASDVYSLGALLYFLVTGRAPFAAGSLEETLHQVLEADPVSPRLLNPALPSDLETICLKCLRKEPPRRYTSARALAEDLGRFLADEPIHARPARAPEKLWRWCRRKPMTAALIVALQLVGALGLTGILWQRERARESAIETRFAQREVNINLWHSYLAQARAKRYSAQLGRRFDSLDALAKAAAIRSSPELRDEAIAALVLSDLRVLKKAGEGLPEWCSSVPDESLERYAMSHTNGEISVHRMVDDVELLRLPADSTKPPKGSLTGASPQLLTFSHQGRFLAARQPDGVVSVWNLGTRTATKLGPCSEMNQGFSFDFSPDDRVAAVADNTDEIRLHDPSDGSLVSTLTAPCPVHLVRFSPDGRCLAVSSARPDGVFFLDPTSGKVLAERRFDRIVNSVAWHPDGDLVATDYAGWHVQVWAWQTGEVLRTLGQHTENSYCRAFHPKSDLLFSAGWDATHVWNFRSGEYVLRIPGSVQALRFRSDGTRLFARLPVHAEFRYFEVAVDDPIRRFTPEGKARPPGWMATFSPDGTLFLNTTDDGFLTVHDARTGRTLAEVETGFIKGMAFDAQTNLWTSGTNLLTPGLVRWPLRLDAVSNRWTLGPPEIVDRKNVSGALQFAGPVGISRDGSTLAYTAKSNCFVFDPLTPATERQMARGRQNWDYLRLSPNGKILATANWSNLGVVLWDTTSGRPLEVIGTNMPPGGNMEFSADGQWLAVSTRGDISVWRTRDRTRVWKVDKLDAAGAMAGAPDSHVLVARYDQSLMRFFAIESGQVLASFDLPNGQPLGGLHFSPDGTRLALRGALTGDVFVMDLSNLRARLASMGLDWDRPPYPPQPTSPRPEAPPISAIIKQASTAAP